ncbi:hypothetical protein HK096_001337, partial [Nowakowskiella sp. JEL0078]
ESHILKELKLEILKVASKCNILDKENELDPPDPLLHTVGYAYGRQDTVVTKGWRDSSDM